jgi:acyl-ACP thioesterase
MENYFDRDFKLRYFEMNKYGMASPTTILTLLEETAADHCYDIGYSLYSLEKQNIGWVLISGTIDMIRYPTYKEKISIRTWLSKYSLVKGYRENIIFDDSGSIIGKAKGVWAFYDIEKRKPVPIFDEIKLKWGSNTEISREIDLEVLKIINTSNYQVEYNVYKSDVDSNKHVNNIRYFHWLIESLPDEILDNYILKTINAKFYSEANYGEKIQVYIEHEHIKNTFLHTMKSNIDNKIFVAAHTTWVNMKGDR